MLLFVSWHNQYAIIESQILDATTSTLVFLLLLVYLRAVTCISEEINLGLGGARIFWGVKGQALITTCEFLWVCATHMQSSRGYYSMHHQVPMMFLLLLVDLCAAACISEEKKIGPCWRRDILTFKGQRSSTNHKMLLFWAQSICNHWVATIWCAKKYPWCFFTSFSLSKCCCLHSVEISLESGWRRDILRVKGQALITNCNFLWLCVTNIQSSSGNYSMGHRVPMVFSLLLVYLSAVACISGGTKFGRMLAQEYLEGQSCKKEFRK